MIDFLIGVSRQPVFSQKPETNSLIQSVQANIFKVAARPSSAVQPGATHVNDPQLVPSGRRISAKGTLD